MTWTQHFYVHGEYLGSSERLPLITKGVAHRPFSVAYFCPTCGEVWARAAIEGAPFQPWVVSCEKHRGLKYSPAGCLWMDWDKDYTKAFPPKVLKRELEMLLEHFEWGGEI